ncbi:MAG: hypothetical protein AB7O92_26800 [Acidimicrobiia bacterium]
MHNPTPVPAGGADRLGDPTGPTDAQLERLRRLGPRAGRLAAVPPTGPPAERAGPTIIRSRRRHAGAASRIFVGGLSGSLFFATTALMATHPPSWASGGDDTDGDAATTPTAPSSPVPVVHRTVYVNPDGTPATPPAGAIPTGSVPTGTVPLSTVPIGIVQTGIDVPTVLAATDGNPAPGAADGVGSSWGPNVAEPGTGVTDVGAPAPAPTAADPAVPVATAPPALSPTPVPTTDVPPATEIPPVTSPPPPTTAPPAPTTVPCSGSKC